MRHCDNYGPACMDDRKETCAFCAGGECRVLMETYPAWKRCPFYRVRRKEEKDDGEYD